jgi:hypothetical protein
MKKVLVAVAVWFSLASVSYADLSYEAVLVNLPAVNANATYSLDMDNQFVDSISFQAVYSSQAYVGITGSSASVSVSLDTIVSSVTYSTGYSVLFSSIAGLGTGLVDQTTYFVIPYLTGYIQLASSKANAILGTAVNITTTGVSGSFVLTPINITGVSVGAGAYGLAWQGSNDNTNWYNVSATSITITSATTQTNYLWDFGYLTYRYIRANITAGYFGNVRMVIRGHGKRY